VPRTSTDSGGAGAGSLRGATFLSLALVLLTGLGACQVNTRDSGASPSMPTAAPTDWGCAPGSARPAGDTTAVGVQFHGAWSDYSNRQRALVLDTLVAAGVGWVRIDAPWSELQPRRAGAWDAGVLGRLDASVEMAAARHLRVLVTMLSAPAWAGGGADGTTFPASPAAYEKAIGALAHRYAGRVAAWEVWNEPNSTDFAAGADPVAYAGLLRAAYPTVKRSDRRALVVFGGTQYNDARFVERAYGGGAKGFFDVMATHPYPAPSDAAPSVAGGGSMYNLGAVRAVRAVMAEHGDGALPVWFTEIGWSTHANTGDEPGYERGVTPKQQAQRLLQTLVLVRSSVPGVDHVFWYAERDRRRGNAQIAHFGLLTTALRPKPAARALACYLGR